MSKYFSAFPIINYKGVLVRDIARRTSFIRESFSDPMVFLPYTIEDGMKPEDVAYHYYGSVDYTWLVLLANNMLDPYTDWPMGQELFHEYLIAKYSELSSATRFDVIAWLSDTTIDDNILFYYKTLANGEELIVGPETFSFSDLNLDGYSPMRIYDYEVLLNESKRNIQLVEFKYRDQITNEFKNLIKK